MVEHTSVAQPKFSNAEGTAIDCLVGFTYINAGEPVPFTVTADDPEPHGRALFAALVAGDHGPIAPYEPPPPVFPPLSPRQARLALAAAGRLDDVEAAIDALQEPARIAARIEWEYAIEWRRDNPTLLQLAAAVGLTGTEIDALWMQAAAL